jgi:hypothetical protein
MTPKHTDWGEKRDGFTVGAWKSLAVKALRLGWPEGLRAAAERLEKPYMRSCMVVQVFEDIFPAESELASCVREALILDYDALCARETHHARGHTPRFCALEAEACGAAKTDPNTIYASAKSRNVSLPPRALNVWYTWERMLPQDAGIKRSLDPTPWTGMPAAMLDNHTLEGRRRRTEKTILSGHYDQHLRLSEIVGAHGWDHVRALVHQETLPVHGGLIQTRLLL